MNEIFILISLASAVISFVCLIIVTLCVFAMVGHTEKIKKTLEAMEHLMRHGS